jgi:hypothetical protein
VAIGPAVEHQISHNQDFLLFERSYDFGKVLHQ